MLPFELRLVYEARVQSDASNSERVLPAPILREFTTPAALWQVVDNSGTAIVGLGERPAAPESASGRERAELIRLEAYARAVEAVGDSRAALAPKAVVADAFARWAGRAAAAAEVLDSAAEEIALTPHQAERRRLALEEISAVRQRLHQADVLTEQSRSQPIGPPANEWADAPASVVSGDQLRVPASIFREESRGTASRWFVACLLSILAIVAGRLSASPAVMAAVNGNRPLVLALLGALWWLVGPWGELGWAALAGAIWLLVRHGRRHDSEPASSPTLPPRSSSHL